MTLNLSINQGLEIQKDVNMELKIQCPHRRAVSTPAAGNKLHSLRSVFLSIGVYILCPDKCFSFLFKTNNSFFLRITMLLKKIKDGSIETVISYLNHNGQWFPLLFSFHPSVLSYESFARFDSLTSLFF